MSKLQSDSSGKPTTPWLLHTCRGKQLAFLLGGGELEHVAFVMSQKRLGPYYLSLVSHLGCAAEAGFLSFYGGGYTTFDASG